jgi:hypothetical protein
MALRKTTERTMRVDAGSRRSGRLGVGSLDLPVEKEANSEHGKKRFVEPKHGYLTEQITAPQKDHTVCLVS